MHFCLHRRIIVSFAFSTKPAEAVLIVTSDDCKIFSDANSYRFSRSDFGKLLENSKAFFPVLRFVSVDNLTPETTHGYLIMRTIAHRIPGRQEVANNIQQGLCMTQQALSDFVSFRWMHIGFFIRGFTGEFYALTDRSE